MHDSEPKRCPHRLPVVKHSLFWHDRDGASLVTYALVLPLLIMIVFGAGAVWQVISAKQSMDLATYEAARYLAREGRHLSLEEWLAAPDGPVGDFVRAQVYRNPFIDEGDPVGVDVLIPDTPDFPDCGQRADTDRSRSIEDIRFTVVTSLEFRTPVEIPLLGRFRLKLEERHSDVVECPRFNRAPPEEGDTF